MKKINDFLDKLPIAKIPKQTLATRGIILLVIGIMMIKIGMG